MSTGLTQKNIIADHDLERIPAGNLSATFYFAPGEVKLALLDTAQKRFVALAGYFYENKKLYSEPSELAPLLSQVNEDFTGLAEIPKKAVILESKYYTLVPGPLFSKNEATDYLRFNFSFPAGMSVITNRIQNNEIVNVFGIPKKLADILNRFIGFPEFLHSGTVLAESMLVRTQGSDTDRVFVNIRDSEIDILHLKGKQAMYMNTFEYRSTEDFVYYLLFVLEHLGLDPKNVEVALLGSVGVDDQIMNISKRFIRNISILPRNEHLTFSKQIEAITNVADHLLFNAELCG